MYNMNSPVINNMLTGGGFIPPNPIGNIVNMGGMGYNMNPQQMNMGGYYNNSYTFANPYLIAKQQEMYEAQMREAQRQQADMMKTLVSKVNRALGQETSEELLKMYDPVYVKQDDEELMTYKLLDVNNNGLNYNPRIVASIEAHNKIYDKHKEQFPDEMGIMEFHDKAGVLCREMLLQQAEDKQRDLSQLYSREEYRKLLSKYKGTTYIDSIYNGKMPGPIGIDDMEISLPERIKNVYAERRQKFLNSFKR